MLSDQVRALWAKSSDAGTAHSLIAHMLDVAAVAWSILEREPRRTLDLYAEDLMAGVDAARRWVCALAGLHDLGKASPAFQRKWPAGADRVRTAGLTWDGSTPPANVNHAYITQEFLEDYLGDARGWHWGAARLVAEALGCHHGFRAISTDLDKITKRERGGRPWAEARAHLADAVLSTVGVPPDAPGVERLSGEAFMRLAGLTSFADWIGSGMPFAPVGEDLAAYWSSALARASDALDGIGWHRRDALMPEPEPFDALFAYLGTAERPFRRRPLQACVESLASELAEPTLLLIEAPMGEGKTEAAFYAHAQLQRACGHRGMYVALPTQATGNMMFSRTREFLERVSARPSVDLQLLHGASLLNDEYQSLLVRPNLQRSVDDDGPTSAVGAREWFTHKKRGLLSEYGVGTVDQALLSVLNVRHQFIRLWGLSNRTVVIDEVHAYDTYTSGLVCSLVRWLHALGSSVILMSATLPADRRRELLKAFGAASEPTEAYPRVTSVAGGSVRTSTFEARKLPQTIIKPAAADVDEVGCLLTSLAAQGGCVACILNTVQRAQDVYTHLRQAGVPAHLFHARFAADDRRRLEENAIRLFGKGDDRPKRAVLVATQVVEQSLDLDFDVMVTDLAPVDLVLQRAGRLHRHPRPADARGAHRQPILYIAGLGSEKDGIELGAPYYFDAVYDPFVLLRTCAVLRRTERVVPPGDIDRLVQIVYGDEDLSDTLPASMRERYVEVMRESDATREADRSAAMKVVVGDPSDTWENVAGLRRDEEDDGRRYLPASTRKGSDAVTAVPLYPSAGGFALDERGAQPIRLEGAELSLREAKSVTMRTVRLSRVGVLHGLRQQHVARSAWERHPLLRDCYPLMLDGEHNVFGKVRVEYSHELGIVYRTIAD